ncbi:MAG: prepilin-type N-terminal cleavage/methylation domain-containing protein [Vicinamibacterales bacterium]
MARAQRSRYRRAAASSCPERLRADGGFTLVEVMISMLILTIGTVAIAGLLAVTTQMQIGAREAARSTRLAQDKIDELMKLNFSSDPAVAVGGDLDADATNYSETPLEGITLRWAVAAGPSDDLRVLTLRVVNLHTQQYRQTDLTTIIRRW